jgi:hypothetical protein
MCDISKKTQDSTELKMSLFTRLDEDNLLCSIMNELGFTVNKGGIRSLWLLLKHEETASVRLMPLSPKDLSVQKGAQFIDDKFIEIPPSSWTEAGGDEYVQKECIRVIAMCLDEILVRVPTGYSLLPLCNISNLDKCLKIDLFDLQCEVFELSVESKLLPPLVANKFYKEAKDMTSSQSSDDSYTLQQVKDELQQLHAVLHGEVISRLNNITNLLDRFSENMIELVTGNENVKVLVDQVGTQVAYMSKEQSQEMAKLQEKIEQTNATLHTLPASIQPEVLGELTAMNNKINTILQDSWKIPTLAVVLKTSKSRVFRDDYALYFMCEHTLELVPCGPKGEGFEFKHLKKYYADKFKKMAPVLMVGLIMLKVAVSVYGIPIPLPNLSSLSAADTTKMLNETIIDLDVHDVDAKIQAIARSIDPLAVIDQVTFTTEQQREAYESLLQFLDKPEYRPHKFGLVKVTCEKNGITKWIKNEPAVISSFHDNEGQPRQKK